MSILKEYIDEMPEAQVHDDTGNNLSAERLVLWFQGAPHFPSKPRSWKVGHGKAHGCGHPSINAAMTRDTKASEKTDVFLPTRV